MARLSKLFSVNQFQATRPSSPLPGVDLDSEFAEHRKIINEIDAELKDIRRADGALNNGIVTEDSLEPGLLSKLTDPIKQAVATARSAGAQGASQAIVEANRALKFAEDAELAARRAEAAERATFAGAPGVLASIQTSTQDAQKLVKAVTDAVQDLTNDVADTKANAELSFKYAELSELWAEWSARRRPLT